MRLRKKDAVDMAKVRGLVNSGSAHPEIPYVPEPCSTDPESSPNTHGMLPPYYLTISRGPELVNTPKNISSLLNVNDILVDSNGDLDSSLEIPQVYEGDLMHDDLTEDDRRLAAALVAVQLVNQQKQQSGNHNIIPILQSNPLNVVSKMNGLDSLSTLDSVVKTENELLTSELSYQSQTTEVDDDTFLHPLSPLKKALSRSRYFQNEPSASSIALEISDIDIANNVALAAPENIDFILPSDTESDYDEMDNSHRQTLPHKKRIAKRLKKQKKPRMFSQNTEQTYTCELCNDEYSNQLKFFEHLKSHYESNQQSGNEDCDTKRSGRFFHESSLVRRLRARAAKIQTESGPPNRPTIFKHPSRVFDSPKQKAKNHQIDVVESVVAHTSDPSFPCVVCKMPFRRQKLLDAHIAQTHKEVEVIEEFSEPEDLMEGIRLRVESEDEETGTKQWQNNGVYASSRIMTDNQLSENVRYREEMQQAEREINVAVTNMTNVAQPLPNKLTQENSNLVKSRQLNLRRMPTDPKEAITCDICNVDFETREDASIHINQEHSAVVASVTKRAKKPFKKKKRRSDLACKHCGRTFSHRNSLIYHEKIHIGERDFQCNECGKAFYARSALVVHMRLHTNTKPFRCEFCSRDFRQFGDLKYHVISIHSNKKDYQCEYCGKSFARKYSLTVHNRIHTGEKNYKCDFCEKSFRAASYLQNHRRIHTGEKPYKCVKCARSFRVRSDLVRHMTTHHDRKKKFLFQDDFEAVEEDEEKGERIHGKKKKENIEKTEVSCDSAEAKSEEMNMDSGVLRIPDECKVEVVETSPLEPYQMVDSRLTSVHSLPNQTAANVDVSQNAGTFYLWQVYPT